jgi:N6-adenosine-specific RNA methylase IME4
MIENAEAANRLGDGSGLVLQDRLGEQIEAVSTASPPLAQDNAANWAARIAASYRTAAESILATGRLIIEAKAALPRGAFDSMLETALPFRRSAAYALIKIAEDQRIVQHVGRLPASWGTLLELTKLSDDEFSARLDGGDIRPDMERSQARALVKEQRLRPAKEAYAARVQVGCRVEDLSELADSGWQARTISADPNWHYKTRSATGRDRSPDQHYDTASLEPIKALPVARLAAPDTALNLWCMDWLLPGALEVIDAWGFKFIKVGFCWVKLNPSSNGRFMGLGHWQREGMELCLFATKGNPTRLNADVRQVIEAPIGRHSEKPEVFQDEMERLTAGPYLELFARRVRPGWRCWGDEIPKSDFASAAA